MPRLRPPALHCQRAPGKHPATLAGQNTMLLFRWAMMLLLIAAGVAFAFYVGTGQARFRNAGLRILKWTVLAALGFFGVLILERIA